MIIKFSSNFEKNNFVKLLKKYNYKFTVGDIFAGKIIGLEKSLYLIDIGTNILSVLPISEIFSFQSFNTKDIFDLNYIGEFILLNYNQNKKIVVISLNKLKLLIIWQRLKILSKENLIILGQIEKSFGKGKIIRVEGLKGFIPYSHLPKYYRYKKLNVPLKFFSLDQNKNKIFFTCKLVYFINQIKHIKIKQVIIGCITQVKSYGLFVNVYGLKGLVHISEVSSKKINNLTKLFKRGELINIQILYINLNRGRLSLSLKILD